MSRLVTIGLLVGICASTALAQGGRDRTVQRRQASTLELLNRRVPDVRLVEQPFDQVVDWLSELMQMNIVVRWQVLEDSGIERDMPVSIQVRNVRFSQVMWLVLNQVAGSDVVLAYRASGQMMTISTKEDLGREMITKIYDVSDLLVRIPRASRQSAFDVTQGMGQTGGQGGGGGGQGMFGQGQQTQQDDYDDDQQGEGALMEELIDIVTQTIEPDSWQRNGGMGSVRSFRGLLIVHNTILVHQQLGGYVSEDEAMGP